MDCFTCAMMIGLAVCSSPLSGLEFTITNGPQDTTVCMNDKAEFTCGFDGANPAATTTPDWIIVTRSSSGSVISNVTIDGKDIAYNRNYRLGWQVGQKNITSAPNSKLVVGPVDKTYNQSSYQCVFRINQTVNGSVQHHIVKSGVGILTVFGPPSIESIVVDETCATSISISWDTHNHPVCGVLSQLVTISSPTSDARTFRIIDNIFMLTNLNSNTSYDVTIVLKYRRNQITTRKITIKTLSYLGVSELKAVQVLNSVILAWKPPTINHCSTSEFQYYQVIVATNERNDLSQRKTSNVTSNDTIIILSDYVDIQPNQFYTISVSVIYTNLKDSSPPLVIDFMIANEEIPNKDVKVDADNDDDRCSSMMIGFTLTIVMLMGIIIGIAAVMMWRWYKHKREEAVIRKTQQLNADMIEMQSSPEYVPKSQDNIKSSTVPQYETICIQHCNDVRMETDPAYLTHKICDHNDDV